MVLCQVAVFLDGLRRGVMSRDWWQCSLMDCGVALCHVCLVAVFLDGLRRGVIVTCLVAVFLDGLRRGVMSRVSGGSVP